MVNNCMCCKFIHYVHDVILLPRRVSYMAMVVVKNTPVSLVLHKHHPHLNTWQNGGSYPRFQNYIILFFWADLA